MCNSVKNMSKLAHYDSIDVARTYDKERYPIGADIITGLLFIHCNQPLQVSILRFRRKQTKYWHIRECVPLHIICALYTYSNISINTVRYELQLNHLHTWCALKCTILYISTRVQV